MSEKSEVQGVTNVLTQYTVLTFHPVAINVIHALNMRKGVKSLTESEDEVKDRLRRNHKAH